MEIDQDEAIKTLNEIVELELAGVVRFTQYSLMVFGHAHVPIMGSRYASRRSSRLPMPFRRVRRSPHSEAAYRWASESSSVPTTRPSTTSSKRCWSKSAEALSCTVSYSRWPKDAASRWKSWPVR